MSTNPPHEPATERDRPAVEFPTVPPRHPHVRALLENAMRYVAPESGTINATSGYPVEGWNHEPDKNLSLRSFTQLTAIGQWMELLANVIAGYADTPYLSREDALAHLTHVVDTLRNDQRDPQVSAKGLLGNFLDLASGKRLGLLAGEVEKQKFLDAFGSEKGEAVWQALTAKGWIVPQRGGREATICRGPEYGWSFFDGPLAPYADEATKSRILEILDHRVVMVIFGDNANLSTSVAKTIGALLHPNVRDNPKIEELRWKMERFLEDQQEGYAHLYDAEVGLFYFGWDATKDRLFGWADEQGYRQAGYMDYLVNEFRGPATFVVLRYGLPDDPIKNLGFKIKPYRMQGGSDVYTLAPWEGSAFQALGLGLSMLELEQPAWRKLLENVVAIEIDYSQRHQLPGFLSESYTGKGAHYTGDVGIPEIAVSTMPRVTDVPSLYTLGVAYMVAPDRIEEFLAANWSLISKLLTDHGPWEGYDVSRQEVIEVQTSAHTFSLILGLLGTQSEHMKSYLEFKGLRDRLAKVYEPGAEANLLSAPTQVFAWANDGAGLQSTREENAFRVRGDRVGRVGVAFVSPGQEGVSLSGGQLVLRYRSSQPIDRALIGLKPTGESAAPARIIPTEVFTRFADTAGQEAEIRIPLPATPGLKEIEEVVITFGQEDRLQPFDLSITGLAFAPFARSDMVAMEKGEGELIPAPTPAPVQ